MHRLSLDANGRVTVPRDVRRRYGLETTRDFLLGKTESGLALYRLRPDVRKVYLEPTTRCNLHCRTCVRNVWEEPLEDMSVATFERVLAGLRDLPDLREVVFGGYGEPFAHPRILDYVGAVKDLGVKITISTNGTLLSEERAGALVDLGVDGVTVSLDGTDPETYASVRRGAKLRTVMDNAKMLKRVKGERGTSLPRLGIEFVALKENEAQIAELPKVAHRLGANRVLVTHVLPHTQEIAELALYGRDERSPLPAATGWAVRSGDWMLWGIVELPRMNWGAERRCRFIGGNALVVGWDGEVSPCYALSHCYPYTIFGRRKEVSRYTFGNVNEQDLTAIWMSEDYVRFRAEVRRFNFPSCVDCELRDTCDIAESNEGCWGWCPSCADCLWAQDIVRCP
jgi:tungsten cofactor oxidoreducase radical SAM maturase